MAAPFLGVGAGTGAASGESAATVVEADCDEAFAANAALDGCPRPRGHGGARASQQLRRRHPHGCARPGRGGPRLELRSGRGGGGEGAPAGLWEPPRRFSQRHTHTHRGPVLSPLPSPEARAESGFGARAAAASAAVHALSRHPPAGWLAGWRECAGAARACGSRA